MIRTPSPHRSRSVAARAHDPAPTTPFEIAGILPRLQRNARYLLARLNENFTDKPIFTREDCLHVAFSEVATITRYAYIRETLRYLIDETAQVVEISSTELTLQANHQRAVRQQGLSYLATVARLIRERFAEQPFTITDLIDAWTSDQLLTRNGKRVAIRGCLAQLIKEKQVERREDYTYVAKIPTMKAAAKANARVKVSG